MDRAASRLGKRPLPQQRTNMCQVCKGEEFEQDGDSGAYACVICGNVLLGYVSIAQGQDSDGQELYRGSRRTAQKGVSKAQKQLSKQIAADREQFSQSQELSQQLSQLSQARSTDGNDAEDYYSLFSEEKKQRTVDFESYLHYFQTSLRLLSSGACATMRLDADERDAFLEEARGLWFSYLKRWLQKEEESMRASLAKQGSGDRSRKGKGETEQESPVFLADFLLRRASEGGVDAETADEADIYDSLYGRSSDEGKQRRSQRSGANDIIRGGLVFPSKRLLLGLLYLCMRVRRYPIVPAHIVRWCYEGRLPYFCLGATLRARGLVLPSSCAQSFDLGGREASAKISVTNVLFHAVVAAREVGVLETLAPLNGALVARQFIVDLGLPLEVWVIYTHLCQMYTAAQPFELFCGRHDESYAETVMAGVLVAVRLVDGWMRWTYSSVSGSDDELLLPHSELELDRLLPRRALRPYLDRLAAVCSGAHPLSQAASEACFNRSIAAFMQDNGRFIDPRLIPNNESSSAVQGKETLLAPAFRLPRPYTSRKWADRALFLTHYRWKRAGKCLAGDAVLEEPSSGAAPHLQYSLLLERAAAYLCVGPLVLHGLVQTFDKELVESVARKAAKKVQRGVKEENAGDPQCRKALEKSD